MSPSARNGMARAVPAMSAVPAAPGLVVCLVMVMLAGCVSDPATTLSAPQSLDLHCGDPAKGFVAMESSALGSCWGHVGHHTYFLGDAYVLHHVAGRVFAVEIAYTSLAEEPALPVQVSLDGSNWTTVARFDYPLGSDPEDRYEIFTNASVADVPFRFLRVHMPRSMHEGLAGYLDASNFTLQATPVAGVREAPGRLAATCADGLLDSFFDDHPCWFGGYDPIDRQQAGDPELVHASWDLYDESWFDSPSFFHTYYLPGAVGHLQANVTVQMWRMFHYGLCSALDPTRTPVDPTIWADISGDGQIWTRVAQVQGSYTDASQLEGAIPGGTRFVRFGSGPSASYEAGGCHHPVAFLVDSSLSIS